MGKSAKLINRRKTVYSAIAESKAEANESHLVDYVTQHGLLKSYQKIGNVLYGNLDWNGTTVPVMAQEDDDGNVLLIPIEKRFDGSKQQFPVHCVYVTGGKSKDVILTGYDKDIPLHNSRNDKTVVHTYKMDNGLVFQDIIFPVTINNKVMLSGLSPKS